MSHSFVVLDRSETVAVDLVLACRGVPHSLRAYKDQLVRAAGSIALNIAEGNGRTGKARTHHFRIAYASALETSSALRLLTRLAAVDTAQFHRLDAALDEIRAMIWRLMHPDPPR